MHLESTTSNRVESAHAKLKRQLRSSQLNFERSFMHPELSELAGFVYTKALSVIVYESKETDGACGCAIHQTHQLPCAYEIAEYRDRGVPIQLDVVHSYWRK
ncbi:unnamed protein product [Prunus armeniaca]